MTTGTAANYHVLSIVETCARMGMDRTHLLNEAAIDDDNLRNPYDRQNGENVLKLWRAAERASGNALLPFHVGSQGSSLHRSAVTTMIEASSTLGEALEFGIQYQHLTQDIVHSRLGYDQHYGYLEVECSNYPAQLARPQIERQLSFVLAEARNLSTAPLHQLEDIEVHFAYTPKERPQEYEKLLGFPVRFGSDKNQLVFPIDVLSLNNFCSSEEVQSSLLTVVKHQDQQLTQCDRVETQLRLLIEQALGKGLVEIEQLAPKLNMSVRTLQRRLHEEHTCFSEVYDEVRREQALRLISDTNISISISEIAYQLGFNHITSFYTAFHRWTGMAPKAFQQHYVLKTGQQ